MSERLQRNLLLLATAITLIWTFPYLEKLNNPNENVRLYMTAAIVDHGTFAIAYREKHGDGFRDVGSAYDRFGYVNDKAISCNDPAAEAPNCEGRLYAGKAPGTSYLAIPFYWAVGRAYEAFGEEPNKAQLTFWLRLLTVILPTLLFLWAFACHLDRTVRSRFVRGAVLIGLGMGSLLYSYTPVFAGHALAAAFLGGSWLLLARLDDTRRPRLVSFFAGMLAAAAVVTEYPSAVGAILLAGWFALRTWRRMRAGESGALGELVAFCAGTVGPAFLLGLYHHVCFGAPWTTPYTTLENEQFVEDIAPGVMGIEGPNPTAFWGSFFVPFNGLFFFAPWLLLLLPALWSAARWRTGAAWRAWVLFGGGLATALLSLWWGWATLGIPALAVLVALWRGGERGPAGIGAALTVFLGYALFISSHSLWRGGWTVGPRYIVMAIPFAALGVAHAADRWFAVRPRLTATALGGLVLASIVVVLGTGQVSQGYPPEYRNPVFEFAWPMLRDGWVFPNAGNLLGLYGLWSALPVGLATLGAAVFLTAGRRRATPAGQGTGPAPLAAIAVALATLAVLGLASHQPWTERQLGGITWQRKDWAEPQQAPEARRLAELRAADKAGALSAEERRELVTLLTLRGDHRAAERAARKLRGAPTSRSASPSSH